jgi:hypothetical protein
LSEAGRFLCNAAEQDSMGLDILKPGFRYPPECFAPAP